jgi:hypothetical protein
MVAVWLHVVAIRNYDRPVVAWLHSLLPSTVVVAQQMLGRAVPSLFISSPFSRRLELCYFITPVPLYR